jgi:hypothetical protein
MWSIGLVPGGNPRDLTLWATTGAIRRSGRANQIIGSKDVFARSQWVGRESMGAALGW